MPGSDGDNNEASPVIATPPAATDSVGVRHFDARYIPEFSGDGNVAEWFTRAAKLCHRRGVSFTDVLPERLTGPAYAVWEQLTDAEQNSMDAVRNALYDAFALNWHAAYAMFQSRELQPGESADTYLADLRRLIGLVTDDTLPETVLVAKFISGLPATVRSQLKAGTRAQRLPLMELLRLTRDILSEERSDAVVTATVAAATRGAPGQPRVPAAPRRRCWTCGQVGHLAAACPRRVQVTGNDAGAAPAPASSPAM